MTPEQQIARLIEIAKQNPRARLLPALHEIRKPAVLAELRAGIDAARIGGRQDLNSIAASLRNLETTWKGMQNG